MTWQEALMTWRGGRWLASTRVGGPRRANARLVARTGRRRARAGAVRRGAPAPSPWCSRRASRRSTETPARRPGEARAHSGAQRHSHARHAAREAGRSVDFRVLSKGSLGPNLDEGPADPARLHACPSVCKTPGCAQSPHRAAEHCARPACKEEWEHASAEFELVRRHDAEGLRVHVVELRCQPAAGG